MTASPIPLVVDLDGTLLNSDLLLEGSMALVRNSPLQALHPLRWVMGGKAALKEQLAQSAEIDITVLPWNETLLAQLRVEKSAGRTLVLATASHRLLADRIAAYLGLFSEVIATEAGHNLSAHAKRDELIKRYGERRFDYVGNSHADLPVWAAAREAWVVNASARVSALARAQGNVTQTFSKNPVGLGDWVTALRLHQWLKNLLVFVPLLASQRISEDGFLSQALLAFFLFGLCASSVYVLNDLLDLSDDRHHPSKRFRPFASGRLSISAGALASPLLLMVSFGVAYWLLPIQFVWVLACYYLLTLGYSLILKRFMAIDVIALAMLYTLRIVAGGVALGLAITSWLMAFSMFIFLSLALIKRFAELHDAQQRGLTGKTRGRGYQTDDLPMISSLGAASGYLSVMVLALYIDEPTTLALYAHPKLIWLACPLLLLWVTRIWMLAHRGQMHDDPVVFAIRDRFSLAIGAAFVLVFWLAN